MADVQSGAPAAPQSTPDSGAAPQTPQAQGQSAAVGSAPQGQNPYSSPIDKMVDDVTDKYLGKNKKPETEDGVEDDLSDLEAEKKAAAEKPRKHKLNVKGKEIEVDDKELLKRAQMGLAADEKWQEAAKMRKQVESMIQLLQRDPATFLEKAGFDVDALAEQRIQQKIEEMKKSPEQLEMERLRRDHQQLLSEREHERQVAHEREVQRMQSEFAVQVENEIMQALDSSCRRTQRGRGGIGMPTRAVIR